MQKDVTDKLQLAAESGETQIAARAGPWKVLIVDDEDEVHVVSRLALDGFEFANRKLQLISAYSGAEARKILSAESEIALVLLDVVMENESAGLDLVRFIRDELKNKFMRIVLRTGQPMRAPEHKVITEYDINDYKEKTELTRQKLFTSVHTSLSSYRDLVALDRNRRGLIKVVEASSRISELRSMEHFAKGVLEQLTALLYLDQDALIIAASGLAADRRNDAFEVIAGIGKFEELVGHFLKPGQGDELVLKRIAEALSRKKSCYSTDYYAGYYKTASGLEHILYVSANMPISMPDMSLIEMFSRNVAIAHETAMMMSRDAREPKSAS